MNEPVFFKRDNLKAYPQEYRRYQSWLAEKGVNDIDKNYFEYRKKEYCNILTKFMMLFEKEGLLYQ